MNAVTQWFPPHMTPEHPGVYQTKFYESDHDNWIRFSWFDGWYWHAVCDDPIVAANSEKMVRNLIWRGLAEKPA